MVRTEQGFQRSVAKGAALLDKYNKNWVKTLVENGRENGFDLADGESCVLGNVFQKVAEDIGYTMGWTAGKIKLELTQSEASKHGFNLTDEEESGDDGNAATYWQYLTEAWQYEVLRRLTKKTTPTFRSLLASATRMFNLALEKVAA